MAVYGICAVWVEAGPVVPREVWVEAEPVVPRGQSG